MFAVDNEREMSFQRSVQGSSSEYRINGNVSTIDHILSSIVSSGAQWCETSFFLIFHKYAIDFEWTIQPPSFTSFFILNRIKPFRGVITLII